MTSFVPILRVLGVIVMVFAAAMLVPLAVAWWSGDAAQWAYPPSMVLTFLVGFLMWLVSRHDRRELQRRDGVLLVSFAWTGLPLFATFPLLFYFHGAGAPLTFTDAYFEAMSGLTTTGSTVLNHLDDLPQSINLWRHILHWIGGIGIIVLVVAVLPLLGVGGMQLYKAETPGPMKDNKLTPRIAETARALWIVYVFLTFVCALTYWWLGMPLFDAICHGMSTVATGGFSTHDASIGHFDSAALEYAVMLFMVLGTINFATHFAVWRERDPRVYWRDAELRACLGIIAGFTLLIAVPLYFSHTFPDVALAVRKALFHVISYGTTTGFATADPSGWPTYTPMLLLLCMFMVGCAGSTSGGVKVVRLMLFVKQALREMHHLVHPSAEAPIKLQGKVVPDPVVYAIGGFFSVYIGFTILLTFVMMTTGLDPVTAFSAVAACINNAGPGLGVLNASMASVTEPGKWVLIFTMLLGRLEIFSLLIVFTPAFWRR